MITTRTPWVGCLRKELLREPEVTDDVKRKAALKQKFAENLVTVGTGQKQSFVQPFGCLMRT